MTQLELFDKEDIMSPTVGEERLLHTMATCAKLLNFRLDIMAALEYGGNSHDFDHICAEVLAGRLDFYPLEKSFIIAEVQHYPNYKTYHGFLTGGNLDELLATHHAIMKSGAMRNGCKKITMCGRRGWEKILKHHGWVHDMSHFYLEVE